jgi:hypothetical protein
VDEPAMEKAVPSGGHETVVVCAAAGVAVNVNKITAYTAETTQVPAMLQILLSFADRLANSF